MKNNHENNRIIVALDFAEQRYALSMVEKLDPKHCRLKVGKEMFTRYGPAFVETLMKSGFDVFLDLKFHDIPNTVVKACCAAADLGVWMLNVHAAGGLKMMESARNALENYRQRPKLIAVTILTSLSDVELAEIGYTGSAADNVIKLARLTARAGLDGVVCSSREVEIIRQQIGDDFCLVTPGIRPAGSQINDQQRIMTPLEAIRTGSDYLVIGRPITAAADPTEALAEIVSEIESN